MQHTELTEPVGKVAEGAVGYGHAEGKKEIPETVSEGKGKAINATEVPEAEGEISTPEGEFNP